MNGPHTLSRSRKPILEVASVAFVFATLYYIYAMPEQGCSLLHTIGWVALEILRPVVLAVWQSAPAHPCAASSVLQHVAQFLASVCPLLRVIAS